MTPIELQLAKAAWASDDAIIHLDCDGIIQSWNRGAEKLYKFKHNEILGQHGRILFPEESKEELAVLLDKIRQAQSIQQYETIQHCKNGNRLTVSLTLSPIDHPPGQVSGVSVVARKSNLQNALEDQNTALLQAIDQAFFSIIVTDNQGHIQYVNPYFERSSGYSLEEIKGKNPKFLKSGELPDSVYERLWKTISSGQVWSGELHNRKKSGQTYWEFGIISPIKNHAGIITHFVAIQEDATQRHLLEEQNIILSKAIEQTSTSVVITDATGTIEYVNPYFEKVTGYSFQEVKGKTPRILKSGAQSLELYQNMWQTIKAGNIWRGELHNRNKDGSLFWEFAIISPVKNHAGVITHFVAIKEDITERKSNEEQLRLLMNDLAQSNKELERLNKIKSHFVSTVSHELRTPLTVIKEGVGLVLSQHFGPLNDKQLEYLNIIQSNADKLARLINNVLDFNKMEEGGMTMRPGTHDINQTITHVISSLDVLAKQKQLKIITHLSPDLPDLKFDPDLISQTLVNLINNAIKFSKDGNIDIRTEAADGFVRISVKDCGRGIQPEHLSQLFKPFSQIDDLKSPRVGGTGLGLAICKKIVDMHQGKIGVESVWEKGSVFFFTLPSEKTRNAQQRNGSDGQENNHGH